MDSYFSPLFKGKDFEDKFILKKFSEIFRLRRGYNFKIPSKNSPVILTISGGLDSTLLWYLLMKKYQLRVYPIHFSSPYFLSGQRKSVNFFNNFFKKKFPQYFEPPYIKKTEFRFSLRDIRDIFSFSPKTKSLLNHPSLIYKNIHTYKKTGHKAIILHNSTRLAHYVLTAYNYALSLAEKGIDIKTIFIGLVAEDTQTTRESTLTVLKSLNLYLCSLLGDWEWQIAAPIEKNSRFFYSKIDLIKIACQDKIPIEKTFSCNYDLPKHCGTCKGCLGRQLAFKNASVEDKTDYFISPMKKNLFKKVYYFTKQVVHFFKKNNLEKKIKNLPINTFNKTNFNKIILEIPPYIKIDYDKNFSYLFNQKNGYLIKINKSGDFIFRYIKNHQPVIIEKLINELSKKYQNVLPKKLTQDLFLFLKEINELGFVLFRK